MRSFMFFVTAWLFVGSAWAQQSLNTAAGKAEGGGQVDFSIGQVFVNVADEGGSMGFISEGIQQGYQISTVSGQTRYPELMLIIRTYPNPVADILQLLVEGELPESLSFVLVDIQGKTLIQGKIIEKTTELDMGSFHSGTYLFMILQDASVIKIFKVVKK